MIPRYTLPEMGAIWSEENRFRKWLDVELAVCEVHAEPTTFGLVLALYYAENGRNLERLRRARATVGFGKISGAVGTFAHLDPEVEERVCARLGLKPAPISTQIIQRDRYAELLS